MMRTSKKILTKKQDELLTYIINYYRENDCPPTYRRICKVFGFNSSATAYQAVNSLVKKGYLKKNEHGVLIPNDNTSSDMDIKHYDYDLIPIVSSVEEGKDIIRNEVVKDHFPLRKNFYRSSDLFYYKATRMDEDLDIRPDDYLLCSIDSCKKNHNGFKIIGNEMYYIPYERIESVQADGYIVAVLRFIK